MGDDDVIETLDLNDYSGAILAASVHAGEHGREMIRFVKAHVTDLNRIPNCFISVTLTQASVDMPQGSQRDHEIALAAVKQVMDTFSPLRPGGRPIRLAGCMHRSIPSTIRWFGWCLKRIAKKAGGATDTSRDYEYTDWAAPEDCRGFRRAATENC